LKYAQFSEPHETAETPRANLPTNGEKSMKSFRFERQSSFLRPSGARPAFRLDVVTAHSSSSTLNTSSTTATVRSPSEQQQPRGDGSKSPCFPRWRFPLSLHDCMLLSLELWFQFEVVAFLPLAPPLTRGAVYVLIASHYLWFLLAVSITLARSYESKAGAAFAMTEAIVDDGDVEGAGRSAPGAHHRPSLSMMRRRLTGEHPNGGQDGYNNK